MPESVGKRDGDLDEVLVTFMTEFAGYLVAAGITHTRFAAIMRLAFFRAASAQARFSNDRLNQSAVAAITGFTRTQVRSFAKQSAPPVQVQDRFGQMIEGWMTDPRFSEKGVPRRLRFDGAGNTFTALAQRYGSDIPAKSLLREMQKLAYVSTRDSLVSLRRKARESCGETRVRRISSALAQLLKAGESKGACTPIQANALEAYYPAASDKGRSRVQRIALERMHQYLAALEAAGAAAAQESPPTRSQKGRRVRTRVVLISEEIE